jgi:hypothetical protein
MSDVVKRIDFLASVDANDVHFRIVRFPAPETFDSGETEITFEKAGTSAVWPGTVVAGLGSASAAIAVDAAMSLEQFNTASPGKLIAEERFGTLYGASPQGGWNATGAYAINVSLDRSPAITTFRLDSVTVSGPGKGGPAHTRQVFRGARLEFLAGCSWTPLISGGAERGRIEESAFDRRVTVRCLRESNKERNCATGVVYDGALRDTESQALWLALCLLAGSRLQPVCVETYNPDGELLARTYRPGVNEGAAGDPPFHVHYAPYVKDVFSSLCDRIVKLLEEEFPIDMIIAHLHDSNEGSMERRMQSCLLGIHAASEAWNRARGSNTIIKKAAWDEVKPEIARVAAESAKRLDPLLAESLERAILSANNFGTNARLRTCLASLGLKTEGATKKAVDLRNQLFHNGFLRRRFLSLTRDEQQERFDQVQILREVLTRVVFAVCDIDVRIHSIVSPYQMVQVRDLERPS